MKFLVITTSNSPTDMLYSPEEVYDKRALLDKMKSEGILERAYVKIGGGTVYIINAGSIAEVRNAFRESRLSGNHECEIREVVSQIPDNI